MLIMTSRTEKLWELNTRRAAAFCMSCRGGQKGFRKEGDAVFWAGGDKHLNLSNLSGEGGPALLTMYRRKLHEQVTAVQTEAIEMT